MINEENEIIDMNFANIHECTEYFYNEFGKLRSAKPKIESKSCLRHVRKYLINQFKANLKFIAKKNKQKLTDGLKDLKTFRINQVVKDTVKQAEIEPPKVGQIEAPKQTNETT